MPKIGSILLCSIHEATVIAGAKTINLNAVNQHVWLNFQKDPTTKNAPRNASRTVRRHIAAMQDPMTG